MTRLLLLVPLAGVMVRMVLSVVVVVLMLLVPLVVLMLMLLVGVMLTTVLSVVGYATGARAVPPDPAAAEEPGAGRHGTSAAGTSSSTPCLLPPVAPTIHPLHRHTYIPQPQVRRRFVLMPTSGWSTSRARRAAMRPCSSRRRSTTLQRTAPWCPSVRTSSPSETSRSCR